MTSSDDHRIRHDDHDYDVLTAAFGADLDQAIARGRAQPPARKRRLAMTAGGLAVAGTAAALVLGVGSQGKLDVIAQAQAALAPDGHIVHLIARAETGVGTRDLPVTVTHQWSASGPPRWRVRMETRGGAPTSQDSAGLNGPVEVSYGAGAQSHYRPGKKVINVVTGFSDHGAAARVLSMSNVGGASGSVGADGDPVAQVRALLAEGQLRDAGTQTLNGRTVRRLVGETELGEKAIGTTQFEYVVDAETFAPVLIKSQTHVIEAGVPHRPKGTDLRFSVRIEIKRYVLLPDTPANAHLLKIDPPRGTKIVTQTRQEIQAEQSKRRPPRVSP